MKKTTNPLKQTQDYNAIVMIQLKIALDITVPSGELT